jgi:spermidine synthase
MINHLSLPYYIDLDGDVIEACRDHFEWGEAWDDERVNLHVADGAAFVKDASDGYYDVIVQDSSDPYTWEEESGDKIDLPSITLYSDEHFENISRILKDDGVFSFQAEVRFIANHVISQLHLCVVITILVCFFDVPYPVF